MNRRSFLKVVAGIVAAGVAAVVGLKLPGRPPAPEIKKFGADSMILDGDPRRWTANFTPPTWEHISKVGDPRSGFIDIYLDRQ